MGFSTSLAAGLGVILSAETLSLLGNGVGRAGIWFLIFLIAGAAFHLFGAFTIFANISGLRGETRFLQKNLGKWAAFLLPLSSRLSLTLVAATGLVVTAGFVFNEVFVYWFPNFLFAYLLLGLILIVNLLGRVAWGRFQNVVTLVTLLGLIALIVSGLFLSPPPMDTVNEPESSPSLLQIALVAMLLPVGYDLAVFANGEDSGGGRKSPAAAIVVGSLILFLWGFVSLNWVSPSTLSETTIPHIVAARTILGQTGRIIMGIVILAGTAGAVNSLFGTVSRMMSAMASAGLLPPVFGDKWFKGRFAPLFLTAAAATMLFTGMAGSPHLDAFLRGCLILWLFHYAALHFAYFEDRRHETFYWDRKRHLAAAIFLTLIGLGLLVTDAERGVVGSFMFVCVGSMLILRLLWSGPTRTPDQD